MPPRFRRPARKKTNPVSSHLPALLEVTVEKLGGNGDGLAEYEGQRLYIRGGLPQEELLVRTEARRDKGFSATIQRILKPSPIRQEPPCPSFPNFQGQGCGGCSLQHLNQATHDQFKLQKLTTALEYAGVPTDNLRPLISIPIGQRRRANLSFVVQNRHAILGFNYPNSHRISDLKSCLQLQSELQTILPPLRDLLLLLVPSGEGGDVILTQTLRGLDILIKAPSHLDLFDRETLGSFAEKHDIARLVWHRTGIAHPDPIAIRRPPEIQFSGVPVTLPVGGFLQPSRQGETTMITLVVDALRGSNKTADLFCGCGTFSLPLAVNGAEVLSIEENPMSIAALDTAAKAKGLPIKTEIRNLNTHPLKASELRDLESLVFDPPRAGAMAQVDILAKSGPPRLVAISCNPATFARDLKILLLEGYEIDRITPIDQFPLTTHLEAVAVLQRD